MNKILYSFFPLLALVCYTASDVLHSNIYIVAGLVLSLPYTYKLIVGKEFKELSVFLLVVLIASFLNLITTNNGIGGSIIFIGSCSITAFCLKRLEYVQYAVLLLLLFLVWFLFNQIVINQQRVDDIFEQVGLSKNYPGCMLVMLCCFWGFIKYIYHKKLPLLLPIVSMIMAWFLDGRSSLACLAVISVFCLAARNKKHLIVSLIITIVLLYYLWPSLEVFYDLSSLNSKGLETDRLNIWNSYFDHLDFPSFLFGLETHDLPHLKDYSGNPHNSLLNFHFRMGLIGVITILIFLFKSWRLYIKEKQYVLLFFNVVLWARMFTDTCLVCGTDFIVYTMLFYPFVNQQKCDNNTKHIEKNSFYQKLFNVVVSVL